MKKHFLPPTASAFMTLPLRQLFTAGVARAAAQLEAVIIDGGRHAGVMEIIGAAVVELGRHSPLVGVAPAALLDGASGHGPGAPPDPNHSHLVLTLGDQWG